MNVISVEWFSFGPAKWKCGKDSIFETLDQMNPMDTLHCDFSWANIIFRAWLRKNGKKGRAAFMPKRQVWVMYFKD